MEYPDSLKLEVLTPEKALALAGRLVAKILPKPAPNTPDTPQGLPRVVEHKTTAKMKRNIKAIETALAKGDLQKFNAMVMELRAQMNTVEWAKLVTNWTAKKTIGTSPVRDVAASLVAVARAYPTHILSGPIYWRKDRKPDSVNGRGAIAFQMWSLLVDTPHIFLYDMDDQEFDLGPMRLHYNLKYLLAHFPHWDPGYASNTVRVEPLDPYWPTHKADVNLAVGEITTDQPSHLARTHPFAATHNLECHPHIRGGRPCLGTALPALARELHSLMFWEATDILIGYLQSYNPADVFRSLEMWNVPACANCGYLGKKPDDRTKCDISGGETCANCRYRENYVDLDGKAHVVTVNGTRYGQHSLREWAAKTYDEPIKARRAAEAAAMSVGLSPNSLPTASPVTEPSDGPKKKTRKKARTPTPSDYAPFEYVEPSRDEPF